MHVFILLSRGSRLTSGNPLYFLLSIRYSFCIKTDEETPKPEYCTIANVLSDEIHQFKIKKIYIWESADRIYWICKILYSSIWHSVVNNQPLPPKWTGEREGYIFAAYVDASLANQNWRFTSLFLLSREAHWLYLDQRLWNRAQETDTENGFTFVVPWNTLTCTWTLCFVVFIFACTCLFLLPAHDNIFHKLKVVTRVFSSVSLSSHLSTWQA